MEKRIGVAGWKLGLSVLAGYLLGAPAAADMVTLTGKPPFRGVQVLGFQDGRLAFRGVSQQVLRKPLDQVETIEIDAFPQFSAAERDRIAKPEAALAAYDAARAAAPPDWLRDLIDIRRIDALDQAGRFDQAVAAWLEQVRSSAAAAQLAPRSINTASEAMLSEAISALDAAEPRTPRGPARTAVRTLLLECTLAADRTADPDRFAPPREKAAPASSPASAGSDEAPPLLFGDIDDEDNVVRLTPESPVFALADRLLNEKKVAAAARLLDRSLPFVPREGRNGPTILAERVRIERGEPATAADALLRIAEECRAARREDLAATAIYYVALAHERLNRPDVAGKYYREIASLDATPAPLREKARQRLAAIGE